MVLVKIYYNPKNWRKSVDVVSVFYAPNIPRDVIERNGVVNVSCVKS